MFAHGMCKECYLEFVKVTGGLNQTGANPPSFQANLDSEADRMVGHHPIVSQRVNPRENHQRFGCVLSRFTPVGSQVKGAVIGLQRLEHEVHPALPAYSGEGLDEDDDEYASDSQLEADVDSALADDNLNALAQVTCHAFDTSLGKTASAPPPATAEAAVVLQRCDRMLRVQALVPAGSEPAKVAGAKRKKRQRASKPSEPGNCRVFCRYGAEVQYLLANAYTLYAQCCWPQGILRLSVLASSP